MRVLPVVAWAYADAWHVHHGPCRYELDLQLALLRLLELLGLVTNIQVRVKGGGRARGRNMQREQFARGGAGVRFLSILQF